MNQDEVQTITIIGPPAGGDRKRTVLERSVAVDQVREHFLEFLESIKAIVDVDVPAVGDYALEEFQFHAEITANGEFKLLGTGAGVSAASGVNFTLRRLEKKTS